MTRPSAKPGRPGGRADLPFDATPISTKRFLLRPLKPHDLDDVHAYQKREDVVRYLLWETRTVEESAAHLAERRTRVRLENDGDCLVYAVELPDPTAAHDRVVGDMSIFLDSAESAQFEIGWVFHPAFHRRGYATEAARAILSLCFTALGAHRVFARLDPRNEASVRLCDRLGMRREAHFTENLFFKGEWGDTLVFGLLAAEWRASAVDKEG